MTTLIVAPATGLTAIFPVPQIVRLFRSAYGVVTNLAWALYLGRLGLWPAVMAPGVAVVTYGIMPTALARRTRGAHWMWASGGYAALLGVFGSLGCIQTLGCCCSSSHRWSS